MIDTTTRPAHADYACPDCGASLDRPADDEAICTVEGTVFHRNGGIWHMIPPDREDHFQRFVGEYDYIRRMEGRGARSAAYFRSLPFEDVSGRHGSDWRVRAGSYSCFIKDVVEDLEVARPDPAEGGGSNQARDDRRSLRIVDLGAGNCWMSHRLAQRGHTVAAVDLRTGAEDGLGAHRFYEGGFEVVRAEFDRLPFKDGSCDLAIFNASLHYSENYERTLGEALRVVKPDGRLVILDTPLYRDARSGQKMVRERTAGFERKYGVTSDTLASEEYLTERRLRQLAVRLGITWSFHTPAYGFGWMIRRSISRIRNRREPARFAVVVGTRRLDAKSAVEDMKPTRAWQPLGRAGLRLRFLARQKRRLRRTTDGDILGFRMRVPVGVFHPGIFRSGVFLAELILDGTLPARARVLDVGSGSGICALAAAARGARVTAVDVNPDAVAAARYNAKLNALSVRVLESNLFENVGAFDVVLFNPPYFAGRPETAFDLAWRSDDLVERFSRELKRHLTPEGFALVVLSSDGRGDEYLRQFEADGHRISRVAERRYLSETLTVFRIR